MKVTVLVLVVCPMATGLTDVGLQVRMSPGLQLTSGAVSWMRAVRCQRSGFVVSARVRRQRRVTAV